jgi:pSer/pThr/pTyr-binding forkhead associated (FHA) protein
MHADAGHRRRRRLLLLMPRRGAVLSPADVPQLAPISADDDYLAACQADPRCTLVVEDQSRQLLSEQALTGPILTIGRSPENDVWLDEERVRSRHLLLVWLQGSVFFVAISGTADVLGPNGPVKSGWWHPGLTFRVGAFRLRLNNAPQPATDDDPLAVSTRWETELPRLELQFAGAALPKRPWPVTRTLTLIGRSPVCKIRLDHERILPVQAALVRTPGRLWLINLAEPNQMLVNDAPVSSTSLDIGDRLTIGDFRMEVHSDGEWRPARPTITFGSAPVEAAPPANVEHLLQQFTAQQQKILAAQRQALENLERLAKETSDPAQLQAVLDQIRQAYETIGAGQTRMQEELARKLRPQA